MTVAISNAEACAPFARPSALRIFGGPERIWGASAVLGSEALPTLPRDRMRDAASPEKPGRCRTRQNLTGAALPQIRRGLVRAWRLMLMLRTTEAQEAIDQIELQLDDFSMAVAQRFRPAVQLLRAAGLALQDDSLAALTIIGSNLGEPPEPEGRYIASTICRLKSARPHLDTTSRITQ